MNHEPCGAEVGTTNRSNPTNQRARTGGEGDFEPPRRGFFSRSSASRFLLDKLQPNAAADRRWGPRIARIQRISDYGTEMRGTSSRLVEDFSRDPLPRSCYSTIFSQKPKRSVFVPIPTQDQFVKFVRFVVLPSLVPPSFVLSFEDPSFEDLSFEDPSFVVPSFV